MLNLKDFQAQHFDFYQVRLNVSDGACGLDLEHCPFGFHIEEVEKFPGQELKQNFLRENFRVQSEMRFQGLEDDFQVLRVRFQGLEVDFEVLRARFQGLEVDFLMRF